ncbi:MAG TPA: tRNA pseudouridine(55) synthase TruB [Gemmataceae bacterium]|nr:tRNA pseudouridine(55) synthase TruB [Gemmataceae bacterium]
MKSQAFHGLLVLDKPGGITSRTAVNRVQQWFPSGTRIGHTGTLDPLATGVLVVCIGTATRLAEYVQDMSKTYRAGLRLGARSDTDDADGCVTPAEIEQIPDLGQVTASLQSFVGEIDQVPPNYSAARVTGQRAYALARRGQTVTLQARKITIYGIDILSYEFPQLEIEVRCGKGTYIRSLARDLGDKLVCGALIETLRRTRVGPFKTDDAVAYDADAANAQGRLLPLAMAVAELPRIVVDSKAASDLGHGRAAALGGPCDFTSPGQIRAGAAFTSGGELVAVVSWDQSRQVLVPEKVLLPC